MEVLPQDDHNSTVNVHSKEMSRILYKANKEECSYLILVLCSELIHIS